MPELVLLSLSHAEVMAADRRVLRGEAKAADVYGHLWAGHADDDLARFLCDAATAKPPFAMVLPDRNREKLIAAPLCQVCAALPQMVPLNRCWSMLRKMWSRPGGRQVHFR
jgi:hypothetical protein